MASAFSPNIALKDKRCAFCDGMMFRVNSRRLYCDDCQGHQRWRQIQHRYGLNMRQYKTLLELQDNRCAICRQEEQKRSHLSVDHDHATGKVRGLLCDDCNNMLGRAKDNPDVLRQAALYLENQG